MTHPQGKGNDLIAQISKAVELKACIRKAMKAVPKDYGAAMDAHAALQELPTMENLLERALTALKAESSPHVVAEHTPPLNTQDGVDEKGWLVEFEGDHGEILYAASGGGWFTKDANNAARFHNAIFANCFFCGYWMRLAYELEGRAFRDKWQKRAKFTEHIFVNEARSNLSKNTEKKG